MVGVSLAAGMLPSVASAEPEHSGPAPGAVYTGQELSWSFDNCSANAKKYAGMMSDAGHPLAPFECAKVKAPKNYHDQGAGDITVHVTRIKGGDGKRALFNNPGGPGGAADTNLLGLSVKKKELLNTYTFVGVDPRGTGESSPIDCGAFVAPFDARDVSKDSIEAQQDLQRGWVEKCVAKHGDFLPHITTEQTVRDIDLVRGLMGFPTFDYIGYSGGTWLGSHYATYFPKRTGNFILDSNVDFTRSWQNTFIVQPLGFQRRFEKQFLAWMARHPDRWSFGETAEQAEANYELTRAGFAKNVFPGVSPTKLDSTIIGSLYNKRAFEGMAELLSDSFKVVTGAPGAPTAESIVERFKAGDVDAFPNPSLPAVFTAITCNDTRWNTSERYWVRKGMELTEEYPLAGAGAVAQACVYWPFTAEPATKRPNKKLQKMLLVQSEADPATPWELGEDAHDRTPNTVFLAVNDEGDHGIWALNGNSCVDAIGDRYLLTGELPEENPVCDGLALPGESQLYPIDPSSRGVSRGLSGSHLADDFEVTVDGRRMSFDRLLNETATPAHRF